MTPKAADAHFNKKNENYIADPTQGYNYKMKHKIKYNQ